MCYHDWSGPHNCWSKDWKKTQTVQKKIHFNCNNYKKNLKRGLILMYFLGLESEMLNIFSKPMMEIFNIGFQDDSVFHFI